ncbi:MAG: hypothetical protein L0Y56_08990 [Nitrospira sp.]|nr:hypothetical protein [Nitrospira sp.]
MTCCYCKSKVPELKTEKKRFIFDNANLAKEMLDEVHLVLREPKISYWYSSEEQAMWERARLILQSIVWHEERR